MKTNSITLLSLAILVFFGIVQSKLFQPICMMVKRVSMRTCNIDEDCSFSDEKCSIGYCEKILSIYDNDPCHWKRLNV